VRFYYARSKQVGQAKTFTPAELDAVLRYVSSRRYALRNRLIILMSFWAGMRVGEIAALRVEDVVDGSGRVKAEVRLDASQTKGSYARTVFLPQKLRDELQHYVDSRSVRDRNLPLFMTAGGKPFTANVLTQHFFWLYRKAGIEGASSHSGRRSFITTLASKGIGVRVLASLAGHRSIAVTQKYIDVNDDMKRNAVELI
jgi:integrase/recombinase XerD